MEWVAPPAGSAADRVLDNLGRMRKADWERACRWCPGWDIAGARRLAEEAARGGDERLAWYVPTLEARDRRAPKKNDPAPVGGAERRGRPRSDTGWQAYRLKAGGRRTWASIARELELSDARKGDVAMRMAKRYAREGLREGLPWPLRRALADGATSRKAEGREPRDTLLQVRGDARDADRRRQAKSRKRRYHRRERRKAKASRWRRLPKSNPRKVGHGPN